MCHGPRSLSFVVFETCLSLGHLVVSLCVYCYLSLYFLLSRWFFVSGYFHNFILVRGGPL